MKWYICFNDVLKKSLTVNEEYFDTLIYTLIEYGHDIKEIVYIKNDENVLDDFSGLLNLLAFQEKYAENLSKNRCTTEELENKMQEICDNILGYFETHSKKISNSCWVV
jgi:hypothetical protein